MITAILLFTKGLAAFAFICSVQYFVYLFLLRAFIP